MSISLPLADLHRHLDGSLRPTTLVELARGLGTEPPEDLLFSPGMGLDEALARFAFTLSLIQEPPAVRRVAAEMCEDAVADGVSTLEIRFAPQLHGGASVEEIVDAALEGIDGRAGLILCALYGEDPAVAAHLVQVGRVRPGVVGLDLAGGPVPGHSFSLEDYRAPFVAAAEAGLGRTVHAAEGRPAEEIRVAIEVLGAQRIGHGTTLLDDPTVLDLVRERRVTIEACPTSNWQVGVIPAVGAHPLPRWLAEGVRVCVNTDNTLLSDVSASEELARVGLIEEVSDDDLVTLVRTGHEAAFPRA